MKPRDPSSPVILERSEHVLSRKDIDPDARKVMVRLDRHGFKAYLVGGSVRDLLLRKKPKDFDIATDARPGQIRKLFRNSRTIGRRFRLVHIFFRGQKIIEVSTFRKNPEEHVGPDAQEATERRKSDNTFGSPEEDAVRRDLTINALFYDIRTFTIIDYVGGIEDLRAGRVRTVGIPEERFREDPLRMIRTVRHAVRTGFRIEPQTRSAILQCAHLIEESNPSRMQDEFQKDFGGGSFCPTLKMQRDTGLLRAYFPEFDVYLDGPASPSGQPLFRPSWIWRALSRLDSPTTEDARDHKFRLASLLFPLLAHRLEERYPVLAESLRNPDESNQLLSECCSPLGIPRRQREGIRALWAGWQRLLLFLQSEKIPLRFQKKPYFEELLEWHRFHLVLWDRPLEESENALGRSMQAGRNAATRRRRRRRRTR